MRTFVLHAKQWKRNVQLNEVIVQLAIGFGQNLIPNHVEAGDHLEVRYASILARTLCV